MSIYFIEMSIGGTMTVKVEADTEEEALVVAENYFIDDWENAGPLRLGDIHIDRVHEDGDPMAPASIDASLIADGDTGWEYAPDDPTGRGVEP